MENTDAITPFDPATGLEPADRSSSDPALRVVEVTVDIVAAHAIVGQALVVLSLETGRQGAERAAALLERAEKILWRIAAGEGQ